MLRFEWEDRKSISNKRKTVIRIISARKATPKERRVYARRGKP